MPNPSCRARYMPEPLSKSMRPSCRAWPEGRQAGCLEGSTKAGKGDASLTPNHSMQPACDWSMAARLGACKGAQKRGRRRQPFDAARM